jgi:hypothetical protein
MPGSIVRRETTIGNPTCLLGYAGRESVDSGVFDPSTLSLGGVDEVQAATISGSPTGGTFKLAFKGQVTAAIAYNAAAATVQTELRKLSRLGGGVTVAGSAGGPYTITFTGSKLGKQEQPLITLANNSLTGGTSPTVSITETTKGDSMFANLYVIRSGLPLMANADGTKVVEWDGQSANTLVGIFDGQREFLGLQDYKEIPVYNFACVFDIAVIKNWSDSTYQANYKTWGQAHSCVFKSQGT